VPEKVARLSRPDAAAAQIAEAAKLLDAAKTPVILVGGGAKHAAAEIRTLAEKLDAPVAMTTNGRGILPPAHPLGVSISASFSATRQLIEAADVVLAIGTEFGPTDYDMYEDGFFAIPGKLIRVDIDPTQVMRTIMPAIGIVGDSATAAAQLAEAITPAKRDGATRAAAAREDPRGDLTGPMRGDLYLLETIRDRLPGVIFVGDSTQLVYSGNLGYTAAAPGTYFNSATGYGTLGYGLPAAIGAKAAAPNQTVIVLAGDGGVQFSIAELASAKEAKLPLILLLLNNFGYGEIKSYMISKNIPPLGVDLYTPDFIALGEAYGWETAQARSVDDLVGMVEAASRGAEPTLIVFGEEVRKEAAGKVRP
jgi:acetolactate synthase-1/2/3 large subunit